MISLPDALFLAAAGVVAAIVGTAGGITSLISYPALLLVGVAALPANVANIVALVACWPGSAAASRPELEGRGPWLARWIPVTAVGGAAGAALLLSTPAGAFARVVPYLVALGALTLLAQPNLSALTDDRLRGNRPALFGSLLPVSVYNGYFGAGAGVMTLAIMLFAVDEQIARANALKNMLMGSATAASAVLLVAFGPVEWAAVGPLAAGLLVGSSMGPRVARRIPARLLRWVVGLIGLGLAVKLWVSPG